MNKNSNSIFKKKKFYKIILYFLIFIFTIFFFYFSIPKFLNYSPEIIEKSLKKNSDINIKNISNINYRFFPSPRLSVYGSSLEFEENILEVEAVEIDIILNPIRLFNYKRLDYNGLLIREGLTTIRTNKVNQLLNYINKNKKKIYFKKNTITILQKNTKLFDVHNGVIKINSKDKTQQLSIKGLLSNYEIIISLENNSENKSNIILKIPELDISTHIILEKKEDFRKFKGSANVVVLNNFFKFNFIKEKKVKINNGFARSKIINSLFKGELSFKPYFFFNLDIEPSTINKEKFLSVVKKIFFSENSQSIEVIKKINGSLNFKNVFEGNIIFKNSEILFQNFKTGKDTKIFFDAKISEFGKKGKIQFNLIEDIQYEKKFFKTLEISGFIIPSSSKVSFEKILLDEEIFTDEKIKNYEEKFKNEVINNSLSNIFNGKKINNFLKKFVDQSI